MRMILKARFNRTVDLDNDYMTTGPFRMMMGGKNVTFDFHHCRAEADPENTHAVTFVCFDADYERFPDMRSLCIDDMESVSYIYECPIHFGHFHEDPNLSVVAIENIVFYSSVSCEPLIVSRDTLDNYNAKLSQKQVQKMDDDPFCDDCEITKKPTHKHVPQYLWKDIVEIRGCCYAETFPISGERDNDAFQIDDFLEAVAQKYDVDIDEISTYMMDDIFFDPAKLPFGAESCGCYIDGVAEWLSPSFDTLRVKGSRHDVVTAKDIEQVLRILAYNIPVRNSIESVRFDENSGGLELFLKDSRRFKRGKRFKVIVQPVNDEEEE